MNILLQKNNSNIIISKEQCLSKIKYNKMYHNFTLHQLLACDYPEIIDETMKNKSY
jgi:hypothetical protein